MKRLVCISALFIAMCMAAIMFISQDVIFNSEIVIALMVVFVGVIVGFSGLFLYIYHQVDVNPYYTQMVIKKRDEVRSLRKAHEATHVNSQQ
jgi:uncharacterized membrane protein YgaE (UPF0421/DUF939 family)